jgi:hypothetical protein
VDLSIIIVNWNSIEHLKKCLMSIHNNVKEIGFEIIVIDNASYDGSEKMIRREFPNVVFIQSDMNVGFAKANNMGFRRSCGDNLLFLNPDTEILGESVNKMLIWLDSLSDGGAVGCKLVDSNLSLQTNSIQPFPTILNQLIDIEYLKLRTRGLKFWAISPLFSKDAKPQEIQAISGACLMVKRRVFEEIGRFSEEYFMYSEDIDLCYKIKLAGYKSYYIGEAAVIHYGGGSSKSQERDYFAAALMREAVFTFLKKTRGNTVAYGYKFTMLVSAAMRVMIIRALMMLFYNVALNGALKKWKRVFRWTVGLERERLALLIRGRQ